MFPFFSSNWIIIREYNSQLNELFMLYECCTEFYSSEWFFFISKYFFFFKKYPDFLFILKYNYYFIIDFFLYNKFNIIIKIQFFFISLYVYMNLKSLMILIIYKLFIKMKMITIRKRYLQNFSFFPLDHDNMIAKFSFDWWIRINWRAQIWNWKCKCCFLKRTNHRSSCHPTQIALMLESLFKNFFMY